MKKKCLYCDEKIVGKQNTAKYCSDLCRLRAFRGRKKALKVISGQLKGERDKRSLKGLKTTTSYTCCEDGRFYSPHGFWGEILLCNSCGAVWRRMVVKEKPPKKENKISKKNV